MFDVFEALGIDPEEFNWTDLAICRAMKLKLFYEDYEDDENIAKMMDDVCLSCPVMKTCAAVAVERKEWGLWGGIYFTNGSPDNNRNAHKTDEIWNKIGNRLGTV